MAATNRLQRLHCYLCDLPRTPWSILGDFSETVCRGCCNYEGADRIEEVIEYARNLRKAWEHQLRLLKSQCLTSSGASVGSSPSPNSASSVNGVVDGNHVAYHPMAIGLPYPHVQRYPKMITEEECALTPSAVQLQPPENASRKEHGLPKENNNNNHKDMGEIRRGQKQAPGDVKQDGLPPPTMVQPPYVGYSRQQQEYQELPVLVRETLSLLNSFVPFDVRFKKDHNLIARVFAFEAAARSTGNNGATEHELKIFAEYPHGSGHVFQSASAVAKQMYNDCMKDLGRGLSSGFKYLEYEVHNSQNEWRLLGDLLPEQVRFFREPLDHDGYPARVTDAQVVQFNMPVALGADGLVCHQLQAGGRVRKRKADETNDMHAVQANPSSRTPRKTYKEREDEQMQRHLWMQSQVDSLRLSMAHLTGQRNQMAMYRNGPPPALPAGIGMVRAPPPVQPQQQPPPLPHSVLPNSKSHPRGVPPHQQQPNSPSPRGPPWGLPSSMAALISAAGSVDAQANGQSPGADTGAYPLRSGQDIARTLRPGKEPASKDRPQDDRIEKHTDGAENSEKVHLNGNAEQPEAGGCKSAKSPSQLKCYICSDLVEDTHFVQCPAVGGHKFCFPCSKSSIKQQGAGNDVFCPSGKRCPLAGSNLPWAFMQSEIKTILATDNHPHVKKENGED